jgi:hypothetical protein
MGIDVGAPPKRHTSTCVVRDGTSRFILVTSGRLLEKLQLEGWPSSHSRNAPAEALLAKSKAFAESVGDDDLLNDILSFRANVLISGGRLPAGTRDLQAAAKYATSTGDLDAIARAHTMKGMVAKDRGDLATCLAEHKQAATLYRQLGKPADLAGSLDNQAEALIRTGLLEAVAGMTDLLPLVRELEARLEADVESKDADA